MSAAAATLIAKSIFPANCTVLSICQTSCNAHLYNRRVHAYLMAVVDPMYSMYNRQQLCLTLLMSHMRHLQLQTMGIWGHHPAFHGHACDSWQKTAEKCISGLGLLLQAGLLPCLPGACLRCKAGETPYKKGWHEWAGHAAAGGEEEGADILSSVELCAARAGDSLEVGTSGLLQLVPCPTPRWPDLLVAYMPSERLLFTSKLFSAHVRWGSTLALEPATFILFRRCCVGRQFDEAAGASTLTPEPFVRHACQTKDALEWHSQTGNKS